MAEICINTDEESYRLIQHMARRSPQQDISKLIFFLLESELSRVSEIDRDIKEKLELYLQQAKKKRRAADDTKTPN